MTQATAERLGLKAELHGRIILDTKNNKGKMVFLNEIYNSHKSWISN